MVNKHMYSIRMYISLFVNVSVSLIVSEVLPHMTLTIKKYCEFNKESIKFIHEKYFFHMIHVFHYLWSDLLSLMAIEDTSCHFFLFVISN